MLLEEKCLKSERIYSGKILNLRRDIVELPNGQQASREVVEHSGAIGVVALEGDGRVYLVRQYRYPIGQITLEIPAGKLEEGEDPLDCARRELKEEAGIEAKRWEPLLTFYTTPGFSNEIMHLFLATELSPREAAPDQDEFLQIVALPLEEALEKVRKGEIADAKTILGLLVVRYKFTS
ncbi:ADP-ribose pyrophosphatase [Thermanaeromonas toyohensis ToBE]|uniref:ADP-ribose pyrophosphatase n=1 Tax=Thermanaeromonas toyohensis ToBE TaxID=698762 RepID=A0A1W1VYY8_9FIRM|nr:NUDIX hydrolase [Thermanaeromonas toyohensis]SMB98546.1 ADP-ribose pyrophosphatase [Thermanaeromonas toyohensis ToBE]